MKNKRTLLAIAMSLSLLAALFLAGAAGYGSGGTGTFTAATAAGTVTNVDSATYTWTTARKFAYVQNHPSSPANLYIKINSADDFATVTVNTTSWDIILEPGQMWSGFQNSDILIDGFMIYADGAATYGTDFVVKGVD